MKENIGFTGHRDLLSNAKDSLEVNMSVYDPKKIHLITGGAVGFDILVAEWAIEHGVSFEIILPFSIPIHTKKWNDEWKTRLMNCIRHATKVEILSDEYESRFYIVRDKMIVDKSDHTVVCYWDGRRVGGTFTTVKYSQKKNKTLINCYG
jgi:uncharacterized phage-like protein YoqJ